MTPQTKQLERHLVTEMQAVRYHAQALKAALLRHLEEDLPLGTPQEQVDELLGDIMTANYIIRRATDYIKHHEPDVTPALQEAEPRAETPSELQLVGQAFGVLLLITVLCALGYELIKGLL